MRKTLLVLVVFLLLVAGGLHAQQMNLNEVIVLTARGVEEALPQGTMVAVLNFASASTAFSDYVIEELTGELVLNRKVTIVDRHSLALIREEMNLQLSGDVSDESAQAVGKMLGAQSIVSGTLTNMGTYHRFRIRVISVETAAIQTQVTLNLQNDSQVAFLLGAGSASAAPDSQQESTISSQPSSIPDNYSINRDRRKKWFYAGGFLGIVNGKEYEETSDINMFAIGGQYELIPLDLVLSNSFAIELAAELNAIIGFGGYLFVPILGKMGVRYNRVGVSFNAGYAIGSDRYSSTRGFSLGGTLGIQLYPGVLFLEFLSMPSLSSTLPKRIGNLDSAMMLFAGYKFGIGPYRERSYNRNK